MLHSVLLSRRTTRIWALLKVSEHQLQRPRLQLPRLREKTVKNWKYLIYLIAGAERGRKPPPKGKGRKPPPLPPSLNQRLMKPEEVAAEEEREVRRETAVETERG